MINGFENKVTLFWVCALQNLVNTNKTPKVTRILPEWDFALCVIAQTLDWWKKSLIKNGDLNALSAPRDNDSEEPISTLCPSHERFSLVDDSLKTCCNSSKIGKTQEIHVCHDVPIVAQMTLLMCICHKTSDNGNLRSVTTQNPHETHCGIRVFQITMTTVWWSLMVQCVEAELCPYHP